MIEDVVKEKRKTSMIGWITKGKTIPCLPTQQSVIDDPAIKKMPGRQNKRKGTKYRKLSRIAKNSRKRNRAKTF